MKMREPHTLCSTTSVVACGSSASSTTFAPKRNASTKPVCPGCSPIASTWAFDALSAAAQVLQIGGQAVDSVLAQAVLEQKPDVAQRIDVAAEHVALRIGVRADRHQHVEDRPGVAAPS